MEIDHDGHSLRFGTKGQFQDILLARKTVFRINPHTESGCIQAVFTHQNSILARLTLCVIELYAMCLKLGSAADISPQPEGVIASKHLERLLHHRTLLVEHREVFAHIP